MKIILFKSKEGSISLVEEDDYIKQIAHFDYGHEKVGEIISDSQNISKFVPFIASAKFKEKIL